MKRPPLDSPNRSQLRRGSFLIVLSRRLAVLVFFLCAALLVQPCAAFPFQWEYTGSLNIARLYHTATLLSDGRVLVAAGVDDTGYPAASTELYDPATGNWTFTGSLNTARGGHTATLLPDGRVLIVGGYNYDSGGTLASAELYNPATGTWTVTGSLNTGRSWHTATLLSDGRILIVGGYDQDGALASAELYDPATGTWTVTGSLNIARAFHTATLLANGEVLAAGGVTLASAELYDPATATWTFTGSLNAARDSHTATLLADGEVLVAGGESEEPVYRIPAGTELYDPATGTWILTGSLNTKRYSHTATLLSNGDVLVVGGIGGPSGRAGLASAELYASATGDWNFTGSFNTTRGGHTATLLVDGRVLVAGGAGTSAELYDPGIGIVRNVDGGGAFDNQGNQVTFDFRANQSEDGIVGSFSFCDPVAGVCITKGKIEALSITRNTADFSGETRLEDGRRVTFDVSATDTGPGTSDTMSISLSNGYFVSGTLTSGNIRIQ